MRRKFKGGTTELNLSIIVYDTTSTTGAGLSGLTHTTSGLILEYRRSGQSTWTQLGVSAGLVSKNLGDYVSGGICANGSRAGRYEIGIPDAAIAAGVRMVEICLRGAANMHPVDIEIELDAVDYQVDAFGAIKPTTAGRTLDVSAGGEAGIDLANIGSPTTTVNLSGVTIKTATDIETDTQDIQSRIPAALIDGRMVANAQSVTDKSGYTLTQAFPANFSLLSITNGGAIASVINVLVVDELGGNALTANDAGAAITAYVWNALTTDTYVDRSFGDRVLISTNNTRTVAVTGSSHVAAVLHDAEPNSIPEDAFVSGALSARVIATDAIDGDALASSAITEIATAVGTLQVLTRLDSMIESDGAGQFRFDTIALEMAPSGGGGGGGTDWTANERTAFRTILGFDSSGNVSFPSSGVLDAIKDKTDLITSGNVQTSIPVTAQGQINGPLYIGDDYLAANGRAFDWVIALPTGFVAATSTCKFGMDYSDESGPSTFLVSGTVTDAGGGNVRLRFELPRAITGALKAGFHRWSTEIVSAAGVEVTAVAYSDRKLVEWREKQT